MNCIKCGHRLRCKQTYYSPHNEIIRVRKCEYCNYSVYTLEFEVDYNEKLADDMRAARHDRYNTYIKPKKRRKNDAET